MKELFRNLMDSYRLYRTYNRLYRQGILRKTYSFSQVFEGVKIQKGVDSNG